MSSSSSDSDCAPLLYRDRPEWANVKPIKLKHSADVVVPVESNERYNDMFDYVRGAMAEDVLSDHALELTADCIFENPANYTVWCYRRRIIRSLKKDPNRELTFTGSVIKKCSKSYQVWQHRREIVELLGKGDQELVITEEILNEDPKNYHVWQHRHWAVEKFQLFDKELDFTDDFLKRDIRNNSVWTYRHFVISKTTGFTPEVVEKEIAFTIFAINTAPHNESSWNYLKSLCKHTENKLNEPRIIDFCTAKLEEECRSVHLYAFLIDAAVEVVESNPARQDKLDFALKLLNALSTEYDVLRYRYWNWLAENLAQTYRG